MSKWHGFITVERTIAILDLLSQHGRMSVQEVSERLGIDKSTASRHLSFLNAHNLVMRDLHTRKYGLGFRLNQWVAAAARRIDLQQAALPFLERLRSKTGESSRIWVRRQWCRVCVQELPGWREPLRTFPVGALVELFPGATGRVFLANLPAAEVEQYLEGKHGMILGNGEVVDKYKVLRELDETRSRGWAASSGERGTNGAAVSAPIWGYGGELVGVLSVTGARQNFRPVTFVTYAKYVLEEAEGLSRRLGGL